jgi:magnesium transporter
MTIGQARAALRQQLRSPDFVYYVYAVDNVDSRKLEGVVSLRDLLVQDDSRYIGEVMERDILAIDPLEPATAAARRVCELHLAALPVVSRDGRLLGAVPVDTALTHIAPTTWRDQSIRIFS